MTPGLCSGQNSSLIWPLPGSATSVPSLSPCSTRSARYRPRLCFCCSFYLKCSFSLIFPWLFPSPSSLNSQVISLNPQRLFIFCTPPTLAENFPRAGLCLFGSSLQPRTVPGRGGPQEVFVSKEPSLNSPRGTYLWVPLAPCASVYHCICPSSAPAVS